MCAFVLGNYRELLLGNKDGRETRTAEIRVLEFTKRLRVELALQLFQNISKLCIQ